MKKGVTLTEMLVGLGIIVTIAGGVILTMTRGASNVHRGSFHAIAANQAAWIVSLMRRDIARTFDPDQCIEFVPDSGKLWSGSTDFKVRTHDGKEINYTVESTSTGKVFVRSDNSGRRQRFAAESLAEFTVEYDKGSMLINMLFKDPGAKAVDLNWTARIYPPLFVGPERFWEPLHAD